MSATPSPGHRTYWCFISYRHADNKEPGRQWATWLHQAIETYEVPADLVGTTNERGDVIPERIFPVFRDEEELPVDADLATPIYRALDASKFLIVICSPRAVASTYVGSEIRYFKQLGHADRVLAAMVEGEPNTSWDEGKLAQGFKVEDECFPEAIRHQVASDGSLLSEQTEPIAADFRLGNGQGWTSPEAYRLALRKEGLSPQAIAAKVEDYRKQSELMKLKIIAGILGVPLGTLTKRDKAYQLAVAQKRAMVLRRWLAAVGLLAVLAIAGGCFGWWYEREAEAQRKLAVQNADRAEEQRQQADKEKKLAEQNADRAEAQRQKAVETLSQSDYLQGTQLAIKGFGPNGLAYLARSLRGNPRNQAALAQLYTLLVSQHSWPLPVVEPMRHKVEVLSAGFSLDGTRLVTACGSLGSPGYAQVWDAHTGQPIGQPMPHDDQVNSARFSPDGMEVVTASWDKTAQLWDAHTGQPIGQPMRHDAYVYSASFSPDGTRVVTVSNDVSDDVSNHVSVSNARLWDAHTGQSIGQPMRHDYFVTSAGFSPDGMEIVTASADGTARLWDAHTGQPIGAPMRHEGDVNSAGFSPDGTEVITASSDKTARLWDAHTGQPIGQPIRHDADVTSASFSPDGTEIVTATDDKTVLLWDAHTGQPIGQPMFLPAQVVSAAFSPDSSRLVTSSGSSPGYAQVWDAHTGQPIGQPIRHEDQINSASFSPDGMEIATSSDDKTARIWIAPTSQPTGELILHDADDISASFSPDGAEIVTAGTENVVPIADITAKAWDNPKAARILDAHTGQPIGQPMRHEHKVDFAGFSSDGTEVVTASRDKTAQIWDAHTGQPIGQPMRQNAPVVSAAFSPDGKEIVTASWDKTAQLWDAHTGQPIGQPMRHDGYITSASFSSDDTRVVTSCGAHDPDPTKESLVVKGYAQLWDARTGQPIGQTMRHDQPVNSASFSPDGTEVITASGDKTARLWDASTGQPIGQPMHHKDPVNSASFSADGTRVVTACGSLMKGYSQLWDAHTGQSVGQPMYQGSIVSCASFSPDGMEIVTASWENAGAAQLWDAHTGQPIGQPLYHGGYVASASFSPEGTEIITISSGYLRLWDVLPPKNSTPPAWLLDLAEAVGGLVLSDSGSLVPVDPDKFFKLKAQLANAPGDDFWSKVGRWFFADRDKRTISPQSTITTPEYRAREAAANPPVPTQNNSWTFDSVTDKTAPSSSTVTPVPADSNQPSGPIPGALTPPATENPPSPPQNQAPPSPDEVHSQPTPAPPAPESEVPQAEPFNPGGILQNCIVNTTLGAIFQTDRFDNKYKGNVVDFVGTVARLNEKESLVVFHGGGIYPLNWDVQLTSTHGGFVPNRTYRVQFRLTSVKTVPFSGYSFRGEVIHRELEK